MPARPAPGDGELRSVAIDDVTRALDRAAGASQQARAAFSPRGSPPCSPPGPTRQRSVLTPRRSATSSSRVRAKRISTGRAAGAPQHDARGAVVDVRGSDRARPAAPGAARGSRSSPPRRRRPSSPAAALPSSRAPIVHGHPPVAPKRSVRMRSGSWPSATSPSATASTKPVGPHTKPRGRSAGGHPTSSSMARSTRRAKPVQPRAAACVGAHDGDAGSRRDASSSRGRARRRRARRRAAGAPRRRCRPAARCRSIAISGTMPEPPAISSSGPPCAASQ